MNSMVCGSCVEDDHIGILHCLFIGRLLDFRGERSQIQTDLLLLIILQLLKSHLLRTSVADQTSIAGVFTYRSHRLLIDFSC
ncbi:hypothetical protein L1887_15138 [Cichorium endivia]|nr:hypothetical protein L1887_15138 [Cichorium endivia]